MAEADAAWRATLRAVSIADLVQRVGTDSGSDALPAISTWLTSPNP